MYWYYAISAINPFEQLKCALELKLSNFKIFENCKYFVSLTDNNNQPTALTTEPRPPFFPSTMFISVRMDLCYFRGAYFHFM